MCFIYEYNWNMNIFGWTSEIEVLMLTNNFSTKKNVEDDLKNVLYNYDSYFEIIYGFLQTFF